MKLVEQFGAELLQDILKAYQQSGGVEVFMQDEKLLETALLQLLAPTETPPKVVINFADELPWLSADRLSYRNEQVEDAVEVSTKRIEHGT